jgi:hypothetical protein
MEEICINCACNKGIPSEEGYPFFCLECVAEAHSSLEWESDSDEDESNLRWQDIWNEGIF